MGLEPQHLGAVGCCTQRQLATFTMQVVRLVQFLVKLFDDEGAVKGLGAQVAFVAGHHQRRSSSSRGQRCQDLQQLPARLILNNDLSVLHAHAPTGLQALQLLAASCYAICTIFMSFVEHMIFEMVHVCPKAWHKSQ
jgi:predicted RNA polymerase sigma factor